MARQQGKGIAIGNKIRVGFPKSGTKQDGSLWQLFTYKETIKNQQTGDYDEIGRYTIFVNNPQSNLQNGDYVTIKNITKTLIEKNIVNNREYININCWCEIETNNVQPPINNPQLDNIEMETPNFANEFGIDENLDLPF